MEQILGERHHVVDVAVGLVELEHRELGVVPGGDAFVAEVAVDLVDLLHASDREPLQVELGGDAQIQLHPQRVVVRLERTRDRPSGDRLEHGSFDLNIAPLVEKAADRLNEAASGNERLSRVWIRDEVEVALAVADFDVGQAVPFLRERLHSLRQKRERLDPDRKLSGLRPEERTLDPDEVPQVEVLVDREVPLRDRVLPYIDLEFSRAVAQMGESRLAERPESEDTPRGPNPDRVLLRLLGRAVLKSCERVRDRVGPLEPRRVDIDPKGFDGIPLPAPLLLHLLFYAQGNSFSTQRRKGARAQRRTGMLLSKKFIRVFFAFFAFIAPLRSFPVPLPRLRV